MKNGKTNFWVVNRLTTSLGFKRCGAGGILILLAAMTAVMAGCAPGIPANPAAEEAVRKYESWLQTQFHKPSSGVAVPKRSEAVVFVTDLRRTPELGLLKVYLKDFPQRAYYVYGNQIDRLISPAFYDGLAAVVVPVGR
jgi:hypothetical protein